MSVLTAVLTDAGRVALDVARVECRFVEWRREQQRHAIQWPDQFAFNGGHGTRRTLEVSRTRDYCPGLRNCINPALLRARCTEHGAVVEPCTAVPLAIPRCAFQRGLQSVCARSPRCGASCVAPCLGKRGEGVECRVEQPTEPHAFATAVFTDTVQTVVPVTG